MPTRLIELKVEDRALLENLRRLRFAAIPALTEALMTEAEVVMTTAKDEYVPVVTGALRASGHVQPPEITPQQVKVTIAFGGPSAKYAAIVHENPRTGRTGGLSPSGRRYQQWSRVGGFKFLERPLQAAQRGLAARVGRHVAFFWRDVLR